MMKWIDKFVRSFWGETLMGAALICALIWFFGPLLGLGSFHPFASEFERIIAISVLVLLFVIVNLVHELRERKKEKELEEGVTEAKEESEAEKASAEELALLSEKMKEALHELKRAKLGGKSRRPLYQLPWYLFIGPPGSGKTTALVNCGLRFPLADSNGAARDQGRGRNPPLRLVVHRSGGADRHRRPLHDAGFRRGGGCRVLARVPEAAQEAAPAPAAERGAGGDQPVRSGDAIGE